MYYEEVYEEPIVPIFIEHEKEVHAYYSRIDGLASNPQAYINNQSGTPYQVPNQYPPSNYPQNYGNTPGMMPQPYPPATNSYNPNHNTYPNSQYGYASPYPNPVPCAQYGYPYPGGQYNTGYQPYPTAQPQMPSAPSSAPWPNQSYGTANYGYPNYGHTMPNNTPPYNDNSSYHGWSDVLSLNDWSYENRGGSHSQPEMPNKNYAYEDTIAASQAPKHFQENLENYRTIGIGWNV